LPAQNHSRIRFDLFSFNISFHSTMMTKPTTKSSLVAHAANLFVAVALVVLVAQAIHSEGPGVSTPVALSQPGRVLRIRESKGTKGTGIKGTGTKGKGVDCVALFETPAPTKGGKKSGVGGSGKERWKQG
jgi:hypothetical protein